MYRDDDTARADRANALIDEIAELEREKLGHDQRLEDARTELRTLGPQARTAPSLVAHLCVFAATAGAAFFAYMLLA
jgi:hypothetical protein